MHWVARYTLLLALPSPLKKRDGTCWASSLKTVHGKRQSFKFYINELSISCRYVRGSALRTLFFFHEQSNIHHVTLETQTSLKDEIVPTPFPVRSLNAFNWL